MSDKNQQVNISNDYSGIIIFVAILLFCDFDKDYDLYDVIIRVLESLAK